VIAGERASVIVVGDFLFAGKKRRTGGKKRRHSQVWLCTMAF
jgi:hypothetical protein